MGTAAVSWAWKLDDRAAAMRAAMHALKQPVQTSADFALQMIAGVERVRFHRG